MKSTDRVALWNAALYGLLVLAPLNVDSQDATTLETHGIVVSNMDRSVKPGDDFYHYANGNWIKRTELPADHSSIDPNDLDDDYMDDLTRKRATSLIAEAANANADPAQDNRCRDPGILSALNEV